MCLYVYQQGKTVVLDAALPIIGTRSSEITDQNIFSDLYTTYNFIHPWISDQCTKIEK